MTPIEIEAIQKRHASEECKAWLSVVAELETWSMDNEDQIKRALSILSQATKALRRHGHFNGLKD